MPPLHQILTRCKLWQRAQGFSRPREDQRESRRSGTALTVPTSCLLTRALFHPLPSPGWAPTGRREVASGLGLRSGRDRWDVEGATRGGGSEGSTGGAVVGGGWWRLEPRPARRQMEREMRREAPGLKEERARRRRRAGWAGQGPRGGRRGRAGGLASPPPRTGETAAPAGGDGRRRGARLREDGIQRRREVWGWGPRRATDRPSGTRKRRTRGHRGGGDGCTDRGPGEPRRTGERAEGLGTDRRGGLGCCR